MKHLPSLTSFVTRSLAFAGAPGALVVALLVAGLSTTAVGQPLSITTLAGQAGTRGTADGTGTAARFFGPSGIVADGSGGFYVADALNNTIRRVSSGGIVTTVAGGNINELTNLPEHGYADGTGRNALFSTGYAVTAGPDGPVIVSNYGALTMARDTAGNLYLADTLNHVIRKMTPEGVVSTLAGAAGTSGSVDATGTAAQFSSPYGVAVDSSGNIYVADAGNNTIRKVTAAGVVTTLAGRDGANAGSVDGIGANARFTNPSGIATDSSGNIYVSDTNNHTIRKVTPAGAVTTLAGAPAVKGASDGFGSAARFSGPTGLAVDSSGNIYVADTGNGTIRKISTNGAVSTIAGFAGLSGAVEGTGNAVRFTTPYGVAVDSSGNVFIADSGNNTIRKGVAASGAPVALQTQPRSQYVNVGARIALSVTATSTPAPTYQWRKNNVNVNGATAASYVISAAQFSDGATYTVVVTNGSVSVTSSAAVVEVYSAETVIPGVIFKTQPTEQTVATGQSATLFVEVFSATEPTYQWQKNETNIAGANGASYTIASATSADAGNYRVIVSTGGSTENSIIVGVTVTGPVTPPPPPPPPPSSGHIINLSILTSLAGGTDDFTMGYVVGGNGTNGAKPLLIRAAGPSLGALGVGGTMDDPKFDLFTTTKIGGNDNWGGGQQLVDAMSAVGAFPYASPTTKDAAATASITTRDNSVVVSSANNGAGTVIAEIYDSTPTASFTATTPRLINVSVRKALGDGLTAGFVLGGSASTKVLIRVVGPTLGTFGVGGVVADPQLILYNDKSAKIGENNDWGGTTELSTAFTSVGAFGLPATSKDAVLLVTLPPGLYSVAASGVGGTTGVALVEVYEVP